MNHIAYGILTWDSTERRSRRYGTVNLSSQNFNEDAKTEATADFSALNRLDGQKVRLYVQVLETRESGHAGDLRLNIFPSRPEVDEIIELGVGTFFHEQNCIGTAIGLQPNDSREEFWLDPRALYRVHDQTVAIYAEPTHLPHHVVKPFQESADGIYQKTDTRTGETILQVSGKDIIGIQREVEFEAVGGGMIISKPAFVPIRRS